MWDGRRLAPLIGSAVFAPLLLAAPAAAHDRHVAIFAGVPVSNNWDEVFFETSSLEFRDAGLLGLALGRDWPSRWARLTFGIEAQAVAYSGEQDHLEVNLPVSIRYGSDLAALRSVAFGIGLSYATELPAIEVANKGGSEQTLLYWMIEAEFGPRTGRRRVFTRLHHRSTGFGLFGAEGGFNALVLGLRWRY